MSQQKPFWVHPSSSRLLSITTVTDISRYRINPLFPSMTPSERVICVKYVLHDEYWLQLVQSTRRIHCLNRKVSFAQRAVRGVDHVDGFTGYSKACPKNTCSQSPVQAKDVRRSRNTHPQLRVTGFSIIAKYTMKQLYAVWKGFLSF